MRQKELKYSSIYMIYKKLWRKMSGLVKWDNNPKKNNQREQKEIYVYVTAKHQHKQSKYVQLHMNKRRKWSIANSYWKISSIWINQNMSGSGTATSRQQ